MALSRVCSIVKSAFGCRPVALAVSLALREPKYRETAVFCLFGRHPVAGWHQLFERENAKDLSKFANVSSAEVAAELVAHTFMTSDGASSRRRG